MKRFKQTISLVKNSRGCYILDTVKGCSIVNSRPRGCYDDCYALNIASRYGMDFGRTVKREFVTDETQPLLFSFEDGRHLNKILGELRQIDMPFVRIGEMGDPSWDWRHTMSICEQIKPAGKPIVIITKHWREIPEDLLPRLNGICVNTSVSALDSEQELNDRLWNYERLKPYCKSILRVVSCDFNTEHPGGAEKAKIQSYLLSQAGALDTIFRPSPSNPLVANGVINVTKKRFLRSEVLASVHNPETYFGHCGTCPDMCGINIDSDNTQRTTTNTYMAVAT